MTTQTDRPDHADTIGFDGIWSRVDAITGFMTEAQGRALWACASRVPSGGRIVEIGSFHGRSTCVLATAATAVGARTTAIDPFIAHQGSDTSQASFEANVASLGVRESVDLMVALSHEVRPKWEGSIDFLYIDGKHDTGSVLRDLQWVADVPEGGDVAIHDSFSSIGVTLGLLIGVFPKGSLRYTGRAGSLALFRRGKPTLGSRLAMLAQLPWFLKNVFIKILLRLRLRPVAALFGHHSPADPY